MGARLVIAGLAFCCALVWTGPAHAARDVSHAISQAIETGRWALARNLADQHPHPVAKDVVIWLDYVRGATNPNGAELIAFMARRANWPGQSQLQRRSEETLQPGSDPRTITAFFERRPPLSAEGRTRLVEALAALGRTAEATTLARKTWIEDDFGIHQEQLFYQKFRTYLTRADHEARLDRLLWDGSDAAAKRMFPRVSPDFRLAAEARWVLRHGRGNVDRAIARIPQKYSDDPGVTYERLRWRRSKGMLDGALELLDSAPKGEHMRAHLWWRERATLARRALNEGRISEAYRAAKGHHALAQGADYAEAEWLAGWIALRFLNEGSDALEHFTRLYHGVSFPVSVARAAYWAGRAAESLNRSELARIWYGSAAAHDSTYYGQLASSRLGSGPMVRVQPDPQPSSEQRARLAADDRLAAAHLLADMGFKDEVRRFLSALADDEPALSWQSLVARAAHDLNRTDLAVRIAKEASLRDRPLFEAGYPVLKIQSPDDAQGVTEALVLSIIRQESLFSPAARSPAGAMGLMQLMPATAKQVAQNLRVKMTPAELTQDPMLNIRLGRAHLADLLQDFDGSMILAAAAYNAGSSRARAWIKASGDPRQRDVDVVDWVEMIPFEETRNYVQRVLENVHVYRGRAEQLEIASREAAADTP
jgi:soluble lytic murein transglycosylase